MAVYKPLLADAEIRKDILQNFVRRDGSATCNLAQVPDHIADLFAQEVRRQASIESVKRLCKACVGLGECRMMAAVRDDGVPVV